MGSQLKQWQPYSYSRRGAEPISGCFSQVWAAATQKVWASMTNGASNFAGLFFSDREKLKHVKLRLSQRAWSRLIWIIAFFERIWSNSVWIPVKIYVPIDRNSVEIFAQLFENRDLQQDGFHHEFERQWRVPTFFLELWAVDKVGQIANSSEKNLKHILQFPRREFHWNSEVTG